MGYAKGKPRPHHVRTAPPRPSPPEIPHHLALARHSSHLGAIVLCRLDPLGRLIVTAAGDGTETVRQIDHERDGGNHADRNAHTPLRWQMRIATACPPRPPAAMMANKTALITPSISQSAVLYPKRATSAITITPPTTLRIASSTAAGLRRSPRALAPSKIRELSCTQIACTPFLQSMSAYSEVFIPDLRLQSS
jgi:hypothetical protein